MRTKLSINIDQSRIKKTQFRSKWKKGYRSGVAWKCPYILTPPRLKHHLLSMFLFCNSKLLAKRTVEVNDPKVLQTANSILDLNFLECCGSTAKRTRENILDAFAADHICSCLRCRLCCCLWQVRGGPPANWKYHPATMVWRKLSLEWQVVIFIIGSYRKLNY